jgi:hypothetical protein
MFLRKYFFNHNFGHERTFITQRHLNIVGLILLSKS